MKTLRYCHHMYVLGSLVV